MRWIQAETGYEPIDEIVDLGLVAFYAAKWGYDVGTGASALDRGVDTTALGLDTLGLVPLVPPGAGEAVRIAGGTVEIGVGAARAARATADVVRGTGIGLSIAERLPGPEGSDNVEVHHIATNKNERARGQWTLKFQPLFDKFGLSMDDDANLVELENHKGFHPEAYHDWVYNNLKGASSTEDFRARLNAMKGTLSRDPTIINNGPYPSLE